MSAQLFQFMGLPPERLYEEAMKMLDDPELRAEFSRSVQDKEDASRKAAMLSSDIMKNTIEIMRVSNVY